MSWVLFEVVLALGLAVFIVWWTFPKEKNRAVDDAARDANAGNTTEGKED